MLSLATQNAATLAAINDISGIACTIQNQTPTCNEDATGVLPFWATHGCAITTGFVCSAPVGHCICPQSSSSTVFDAPPTDKQYAIYAAGVDRTVVQNILTILQSLLDAYNTALNLFNAALAAFYAAGQALQISTQIYTDAVTRLSVRADLVSQDALTLRIDTIARGTAQTLLNGAIGARDALSLQVAAEEAAYADSLRITGRKNTGLVNSCAELIESLTCTVNSDCQDPGTGPDGPFVWDAQLKCQPTISNFVCGASNFCACTSTSPIVAVSK